MTLGLLITRGEIGRTQRIRHPLWDRDEYVLIQRRITPRSKYKEIIETAVKIEIDICVSKIKFKKKVINSGRPSNYDFMFLSDCFLFVVVTSY